MKIFSPILKGTTTVSQGTTNLSGSFTGSLFGTAATASYADNFTVGGTLTAQTINVQIITSSIEFNTGSTRNGALSTNTHQFTGSVFMSGSLTVGSLSSPEKISTIYGVNIATTSGNGGNLTIKAGGGSGAGNTAGNLYLGFGRGNSSALNGSMYFGLAQSTDIAGLDTTYMTISSSGYVGIGTTSPGGKLQINNTSTQYLIYDSQGNFQVWQPESTTSGTQVRLGSAYNLPGVYSNGQLNFNSDSTGSIVFHTNGATERARITSSDGSLCLGTTSRAGAWGLITLRNTANAAGAKWGIGPDTADCLTVYNNSNVGVYMCSGATSWSANSDIRLKDIDSQITDAVTTINSLRAVKYSWKSDETKKINIGLIAQDVQAVLPELVDVRPDELGILGVRYTELIPVLVAAIQELKSENDTLKEILQRNNIQ
jgi:hypothetical protein